MAPPPRTFTLTSPPMTGEDIKQFQSNLSMRFHELDIAKTVAADGVYGAETRGAAVDACTALGISSEATRNGVTPELRVKLRHPEQRSPEELARFTDVAATAFRKRLREQSAAGKVIIAPGANRPGAPITPVTLGYIGRMAALLKRPITITTGTNHNKLTVDGNISDHFDGHAADIGMAANGGSDDSPVGDHIMAAGLELAGVRPDAARSDAQAGGLFTLNHDGLHIQCIWKTNNGGNHHNHVHIGVRPA